MSYKFEIPPVVDPEGVAASAYPREMDISSELQRVKEVAKTKGEPITDFDGTSNPYIDYESIDLLLSLQYPRSEGYDEMCFILMGQTKELLFKSLYYELYNMRLRVQEDDLSNAMIINKRSKKILKLIVNVWEVLSTITPNGFNQFRDYLNVASGQQSFMYRHIEFILGNKNERMCEVHRNVPHVYPHIRENFDSPSLYDEVIRMLDRRGYEIDGHCLDRNWGEKYEPNESVAKTWHQVYKDPSPENDLYVLGEDLVELSDIFSQYRWRHFVSVERILGYKPGTGGSSGVEWLRRVVDHRFFPELWGIRTNL